VRYDLSMFKIPLNARMLDVGCGFGDRIRLLRSLGYERISGIDIDEYSVKKAGECEPDIVLGSITDTGLGDAAFDAVLVENVFHHISDYGAALREVHRILAPGGLLCFIEPCPTVARRLLDVVTFYTPVPQVFGGAWRMRHVVMSEEFATGLYPLWLRSQKAFRALIEHSFEVEWCRRNLWFTFCRARKRR